MKKIWINKSNSFEEAEKFDENYYRQMTTTQRFEIMQFLRELNFKLKPEKRDESGKRLRRFIRIIQQK
ncbi:MAG: hypothetical protein KAW82_02690 [Desulfurellaceae bacterium]|nr:hypothetical protein [Desulfurellaceae bacterium]